MQTRMRIAVAGATGRVGHHVADVLAERGHDVVPIARSLGIDVITGKGLAEALAGAAADVVTAPDSEFTPEAAGVLLEVAGPQEEHLPDAARLLVTRRGDDLRIEVGSDPNDPYSTVATSGALLPGPDARLGGPTYAEWL